LIVSSQMYFLPLFYKNDILDSNIDNIDEYPTVKICTCRSAVQTF
jgi:hypothetical protein